ncbi:mitochondrial glycerol-3-phosphate dehydrogenase [Penicillium rubens]|nr:mitochondrial glycerol-3-phosphate dehydrogenase [Penicillium rubens]
MNPNQCEIDSQPLSFVKQKLDPDKESVLPKPELEEQDPFGDESQAGVKYKTMAWWQAGMIMIAETISLGILALPKALAVLGLIPYDLLFVDLQRLS